jgi:uncharacterized damage-inducible protein DinB
MNADAFRHFYAYHFAENRKIWDRYVSQLSDEQFTQHVEYSRGSVRDQILHLISCDDVWFSGLRGAEFSGDLNPADFPTRESIRERWDQVERSMRAYLAALQDEMLFAKPLEGEDKDLIVWQVLLHVANHGTDHRAQILKLLNEMGVDTKYQDYIFYTYENLMTGS